MRRNSSVLARPRRRIALLTAVVATLFTFLAAKPPMLQATPTASSHWYYCNNNAVSDASSYFWNRLYNATYDYGDIPNSFWTDTTYRHDIAKIVCFESSFNYHADNGLGYYGWYQMSKSLISSEGVSWDAYWYGTSNTKIGFYQCVAGERYIYHRYGNPANAWAHEGNYNWY